MMLHAGVIHIAANLAMQARWGGMGHAYTHPPHSHRNPPSQLRIGLYLEIEWGTWRFAQVGGGRPRGCLSRGRLSLSLPVLPLPRQIYFGAGVFSSVFSAVILPNTISVGASGALMGIMGAWVVHLLTHWAQARRGARERGRAVRQCC